MKVSVIVPVYNQEAYLREALDSLQAQTISEIEFIIINDGSTDSSIDIINEYARGDERFIVVDKENGGVASAINIGNKMARGEFIAEMDSDDYVHPDMYEIMYRAAKNNNVDIIKCNLVNFTGTGTSYRGSTEKIARKDYYDRVVNPMDEKLVFSFPMYAWVSLYRRKLIIENDILWNSGVSSYNDNGFFWQTMVVARRVMYIDQDLIYHRRDNEMSTVKNPDKMFSNFFIEHEFIKSTLKSKCVFEEIKSYFFERKIQNYYFALNVIPYEKKKEFFRLIAEDFKADLLDDGLYNSTFLNDRNKHRILSIVSDADQYFESTYLPEAYKVSVIVPIHNAENFLRNTLDRLVKQTLRDVEFILIENGSTDKSTDIIREYKNKDPRIISTSIGVSNAGHARNVGLSMAHGAYVIFLDVDDEYHLELLEKTYALGIKHDAEVVLFDSCERNSLNGLTKPHKHSFRKEAFPKNLPFSFNDISGNPFDSFMGWPWDKLYSTKYIRSHNLAYQEMEVSNDGYFNFLAMAEAKRIVVLDKILITRLVGHGSNISSNKHDHNPDNQIKMLVAIYQKLNNIKGGERSARAFAERSIRSLSWMFSSGFKTREGAEKYFDLLVSGRLEVLNLQDLTESEVAENRRDVWKKLLMLKNYRPGEYMKFIAEVGGVDFQLAQTKTLATYRANPAVQDRSARLIFGQRPENSIGKFKPWFNIILDNRKTSNVSAVIDFMYMGHFKRVVRDTLDLSIALHEGQDGQIVPIVHQAEWESGRQEMLNSIFYSFVGNVLTIHVKYSDQHTGFKYRVRSISSREGIITYSIAKVNSGYDGGLLHEKTLAILPIRDIRMSQGVSNRTVFRVPSMENSGQNILHIEFTPYRFNNLVLTLDIAKVPNNKSAAYDTLCLGMFLERENEGGPLAPKVFQAEWMHGREGLKNSIYYYFRNNEFFLGVKYFEQWAGYTFTVRSIMSRESGNDYFIHKLAPELIEEIPSDIPENAVFINATALA